MSAEGNGRITVSEDRLRALLAEFKIDLLKELSNYVSTAAFATLESRVKTLELWQASVVGGTAIRRQWSSASLAWVAVLVALVSAVVSIIWLTH